MSSEKEKQAAHSFKENMGSFFHDMLRAAGLTMQQGNSHERIRSIGERMASSIEAAATRKSIEVIRTLQSAVTDAFVLMEKALKEVRGVTTNHQAVITNLIEDQKAQSEAIRALKVKIQDLETSSRKQHHSISSE